VTTRCASRSATRSISKRCRSARRRWATTPCAREAPGDLARKGGILDVFSVSYENPLRIELLGDTIESIRFFDATTQRSHEQIETALVPPCSLLILSDANVRRALESLQALPHGSARARQRLAEHIEERLHFDGMERYAALYSARALLTDFMDPAARIVWARPQSVAEHLHRLDSECSACSPIACARASPCRSRSRCSRRTRTCWRSPSCSRACS